MSVEFESFEFDGKKKTVKMGDAARKAWVASNRKNRPPMSAEQRYEALMEAFVLTWERFERMALRMRAALESDDRALIKQVAQQWVDYTLPSRP
jgi:hypothetical protein